MKININFQDFPTGNESGKFILNPHWIEHLLNLFYQGYHSEVWEEIMDTESNHCKLIEDTAYSIIGQEIVLTCFIQE